MFQGINGQADFEVMAWAEVDGIRQRATKQRHGKDTPAWIEYPEEMARKTVLKRLLKRLQLSPEVSLAAHMDDLNEDGKQTREAQQAFIDVDLVLDDTPAPEAPGPKLAPAPEAPPAAPAPTTEPPPPATPAGDLLGLGATEGGPPLAEADRAAAFNADGQTSGAAPKRKRPSQLEHPEDDGGAV